LAAFRLSRCGPTTKVRKQESSMARDLVNHNRPVFNFLHPRIYESAIFLVVWFALSAWMLFDHRFDRVDDMVLPLAMVSVFLFIAVLLPFALSLVWTRHSMPHEEGHAQQAQMTFRDWQAGDFAVWGGKLRSINAALDMLLPLAAVAFGLTGIGIVFLICASAAN
jgi:hypothetical protein